jgi:hypothetical protein
VLGYGEPSWVINLDGGWDLVPIVIAAVALLLLRVVFGVRLRWPVVLAVVLLAPLFRAWGDRIGMPLASALALVVAGGVVLATRGRRPGTPPSGV